MNYLAKLILGVCLWAITITALQAEQVVLTPVMDATLYEDDGGELANGAGNYLFFGRVASTGDEKLRRSLVKFDVSSIPAEARIDSVTVSFEINNLPAFDPLGGLATLHRVTSSWSEGPTIAGGPEG
ncbi:MAG TPA: hypothetical protein VFG52_10435, partial [Xanthomonadales bacterium]|nr:hypothetical protein [Xanthomonadales bacterium]